MGKYLLERTMAKTVKKYFSPYSKPSAPSKPPKKVWHYTEVFRTTLYYEGMDISGIDANYLSVEPHYSEYDGGSTELIFSKRAEIDNPDYDKQYNAYKKRHAEYKAALKEWNVQYEKWKSETDEKGKESRRRQYLKLKKEFENEVS